MTTSEAIRERFVASGEVLIGVDRKYLTYGNIEPALREVLNHEATELCQGKCGSMNLHHWSFAPRPEGSSPAVHSAP